MYLLQPYIEIQITPCCLHKKNLPIGLGHQQSCWYRRDYNTSRVYSNEVQAHLQATQDHFRYMETVQYIPWILTYRVALVCKWKYTLYYKALVMNMIKLTFMAPSYCRLHFIYSLIDYLCCLSLFNSLKCLDIFTRNQNKTKNIDTLQKWLLNK